VGVCESFFERPYNKLLPRILQKFFSFVNCGMYICIHVCMRVFVSLCLYVWVCGCVHVHARTRKHQIVYMYAYIYRDTHVSVNI